MAADEPDDALGARLARGDASIYVEMFELLGEAMTVRDLDGQIVYANHAALELLGFDSLDDLRRRPTGAIMAEYLVEDEHGRPLRHDDVPSVRLMRGEAVRPLLLRAIHRRSGGERWSMLRSTGLRDEHGELLGVLTVIEDVTAVKVAESRMRILAESGRILASSLDFERTLRNVVEIAVPELADYCSVDLVDGGGMLERVAARHRDAARRGLLERLPLLDRALLEPDHPAQRVLSTGTSELFQEFGSEQIDATRDETHRRLLGELGLRSALIVAMRVRGSTIGLMTLATDVSGRSLGHDDVELAEQLARRAAAAAENARLYTTLSDVAHTLQRALLPAALPEIPGWDVAALYMPTESDLRIDVGGDFYELFEHEGTWFAIIGDVVGKGVTAASTTALMRHGARVACRAEPEPSMILTRLDEALAQQPEPTMATAICLCLHPDGIVGSSAGHPPALIVSPDGELREVLAADPLLGAFDDSSRHDQQIELSPDELLVLYTDGVTDAPGPDGRFGVERLQRLLETHASAPAAAVVRSLEAELRRYAPGPGRDDVAVLALRRHAS